ncbi:MAG: hypothetical protein ACOCQD_00785 [archaeon]
MKLNRKYELLIEEQDNQINDLINENELLKRRLEEAEKKYRNLKENSSSDENLEYQLNNVLREIEIIKQERHVAQMSRDEYESLYNEICDWVEHKHGYKVK